MNTNTLPSEFWDELWLVIATTYPDRLRPRDFRGAFSNPHEIWWRYVGNNLMLNMGLIEIKVNAGLRFLMWLGVVTLRYRHGLGTIRDRMAGDG